VCPSARNTSLGWWQAYTGHLYQYIRNPLGLCFQAWGKPEKYQVEKQHHICGLDINSILCKYRIEGLQNYHSAMKYLVFSKDHCDKDQSMLVLLKMSFCFRVQVPSLPLRLFHF
jgi:hypothetical protein